MAWMRLKACAVSLSPVCRLAEPVASFAELSVAWPWSCFDYGILLPSLCTKAPMPCLILPALSQTSPERKLLPTHQFEEVANSRPGNDRDRQRFSLPSFRVSEKTACE